MSEIKPEELSGLLDGELSQERAEAVRKAIEKDPELRNRFEELERLHLACVQASVKTSFVPTITLPVRKNSPFRFPVITTVILLGLRVTFKLAPFPVVTVAEAVLLSAFVVWGLRSLAKLTEDAFDAAFETT